MTFTNKAILSVEASERCVRSLRWLASLSATCVLAACTTGPYAPPPPVVPQKPPVYTAPETTPGTQSQQSTPSSSTSSQQSQSQKTESSRTIARGVRTERVQPTAAAQALIQKAQAARRSGDYTQASSLLERAQRMSPQAAEVYLELALVKAAEGSYAQAEQFAQKAISLSGSDDWFRSQAWQVIADIRDARGDRTGAAEARKLAARQG